MKIVVLMGGLSPERNVSLSSGTLIAAALRRRGHYVAAIDLYEGVAENVTDLDGLFTLQGAEGLSVSVAIPDLEALIAANGGRRDEIGPRVLELCRLADCTFLALHGATGENGQLQAMLDAYKIPYTGSGYLGSMLAMDKDVAKRMFRSAGVLTPDWVRVDTEETFCLADILSAVGLPAVVKPCSGGSSVGVFMADTAEELEAAIAKTAAYERYVMVESRKLGRELSCAYFNGRALPPVEIIPDSGFYDYERKYKANATREICPAPIGDEATATVHEATEKGFRALRLEGYARLDFILDDKGQPWCLEANTLPGMTPTSLMPQEAAAVGIGYDELCEKIALLGAEKAKK